MKKIKYVEWDKPMNDVPIKGEIITVPVWGGTDKAVLAPWSEIKKLGFELRQRCFGNLIDGHTPALFFMGHEREPYKRLWYVTTETLEELNKKENRAFSVAASA